MKKLMIMIGVLMIAGGISAHGYCGYHGYYGGYRGGVVVERPYVYCAPAPVVINPAPVYYRHDCDRDRYYRDRYYRGCDRDGRYYR